MISARRAQAIPLLLAILLIPLAGCMRHAYFPEKLRPVALAPDSTPIRLLYDRHGNLYPDSSVLVAGENTIRPVPTFYRAGNWSLQYHSERRPQVWKQFASRYLGETVAYSDERWRAAQDSIRAAAIRSIVTRSRPGTPIVILVHGFNTSEPGPGGDAMDITRDSLRSWYGARFPSMTFVDVR